MDKRSHRDGFDFGFAHDGNSHRPPSSDDRHKGDTKNARDGLGESRHPGFDLHLMRSLSWEDALLWTWSYSREGVFAHGILKTTDEVDGNGFYLITAISGERNGEKITGLQPAGTAIPGNEPFAVDNLISPDGPQLTGSGFGYALADGTYANPFFASFDNPETYLEFFSAPPFGSGIGPEDSELPVDFVSRSRPAHCDDGHRHHQRPDDWHEYRPQYSHRLDDLWFT